MEIAKAGVENFETIQRRFYKTLFYNDIQSRIFERDFWITRPIDRTVKYSRMATTTIPITINGHGPAEGRLAFRDWKEYEKWVAKVNYSYCGFRVIPEWMNTEISVRVKPKLRYKTLRQTLEMALHMWAFKNGIEDALLATGPMGTYHSLKTNV